MLKIEAFNKNKLENLSTKALRLIPYLEIHTDFDKKIFLSVYDIKESNIVSPRLVPAALRELEDNGYITKQQDGTYINNYHHVSKGSDKGRQYANAYDFLSDTPFTTAYKREINFFYYILASQLPGRYHTVAAERLYKNKMNEDELIINYFQDFEDLANVLSKWISYGFLEVRLGNYSLCNHNGQAEVEKYYKTAKNAIYRYCSRTEERKTRIRHKQDRHLLKIRIPEGLLSTAKKSVYEFKSTIRDLASIALHHGYDLNDYDQEYLKKVHDLKRGLYDTFGTLGIDIYRKALGDYFSSYRNDFATDMIEEDFLNNLKNYYIIPNLKFSLSSYLAKLPFGAELSKKTSSIAMYIAENAFSDEIILVKNEYGRKSIETLAVSSAGWTKFHTKMQEIETKIEFLKLSTDKVLRFANDKMLHKMLNEVDLKDIKLQREPKINTELLYNKDGSLHNPF